MQASSLPAELPGKPLGERKGYPLQYSGLENSIDCIVHGVAKNQTQLSDFHFTSLHKGFLGGAVVKNLPASAKDVKDTDLIPGLGRSPQRRKWQPTPVFLPGEFHAQRSLVGYSPWGCKEEDTTE